MSMENKKNMEDTRLQESRAAELRKELLKLKNIDPDLLVLNSEWIAALGPDELAAFNTLLALQQGVRGGYQFGQDEIKSSWKELEKLSHIVQKHGNHKLAEAEGKAPQGMSEQEKTYFRLNFWRNFAQEDYVALYYDWLRKQFEKFFENHPEYDYAKEEELTAK
jgi:hypothetical protein